MDFGSKMVFSLFEYDGQVFGITETIFNTWIIMLVLIAFGLVVRYGVKNYEQVPKGFQNIVEFIVEAFGSFTTGTMGEANKGFAPFYGGMFLFILFCNLSGLFWMRPPTADIATTFALSIMTFLMVQGFGLKKRGMKHIKSLFEPMPFLFPLNVVGELANPVSLSFRLFGNILGGVIIMGLYYHIPLLPIKLGIPAVFHLYFDVFAGVLQTFIFVMLSMTFVSSAMDD